MRTATQTKTPELTPPQRALTHPPNLSYRVGMLLAALGLVAGIAFGFTSYQRSQREIDSFARVAIPGAMTVNVEKAADLVMYYEGSANASLDDLAIKVSSPRGDSIPIEEFVGEMIYEAADLTQGRALATFNSREAGDYEVEVSGSLSGQLTVGPSFALLALPGVLTGLAMAGLSVVAGIGLGLGQFVKRLQNPR